MNRKRIILKGLAVTLIPATISYLVTLLAWLHDPKWAIIVEKGLYPQLFMEKGIFVFYPLLFFPLIVLLTLSSMLWLLVLKSKCEYELPPGILYKIGDYILSYGILGCYAYFLWCVAIGDLIAVFFKFIY